MNQFFSLIRIDGIPYRLMASARSKHEAVLALKRMVERRRCDIPYEHTELVRVWQLNGDTPDIQGVPEQWQAFQERQLYDLRERNGMPHPENFEGGEQHPILIMHKPLPWGGKSHRYA